jgi:hypothetical protein
VRNNYCPEIRSLQRSGLQAYPSPLEAGMYASIEAVKDIHSGLFDNSA